MKRYSDAWRGVGLVVIAVAVLLALLPSRAEFLSRKYGAPSPPPLTWVVVPVPSKSSPPPAQPGDPSRSQSPPPSSRAAALDRLIAPPQAEPPGAFTLHFGSFVTVSEAEDVENRLKQLGAPTTRYRKRSPGALYALKLDEFPTRAEARETLEQLRLRHPTLPVVPVEHDGQGRVIINVDGVYPLREAVDLAGQLRRDGFRVRIETAGRAAPVFTVRLTTAYDLKTAREKSREFRRHGLPNAVVPVERAASP